MSGERAAALDLVATIVVRALDRAERAETERRNDTEQEKAA